MKSIKTIILILLLSSLLFGCSQNDGSQSTTGINQNTEADASQAMGTNNPQAGAGSLNSQEGILVGIFKLEGTDLAVTAEQAIEILPLWETLLALYNSDTTASEEIDALLSQINDSLTDEQMKAIDEMQLNRDSMFELMQEYGLSFGPQNGETQTDGTTSSENTPPDMSQGGGEGMPSGGEMPSGGGGQGGMPAGGGEMPTGGQDMNMGDMASMDPSVQATMQSQSGGRPEMGNQINTTLIEALIALLQSKVQ